MSDIESVEQDNINIDKTKNFIKIIDDNDDDEEPEETEHDNISEIIGDDDNATDVLDDVGDIDDDEEADDDDDDDDDIDDIDEGENEEESQDKGINSRTLTPQVSNNASELIKKFMEEDETFIDDNESVQSELSDEEYVKFDNEVRKDQILNYHNDLIQSNFDEISALTKVVRDKNGIIVDPLHKTLPILTKFERARILGLRSKQLSNGAEPFIKLSNNIIQSHIIAEMELEENVLPFIVCRPLPNGKKEYWKLQNLEQIDY
jgi:DNA-directed RNA polymerase subunit K/omega